MRRSIFCIAVIGFLGCGNNTTTHDMNVSMNDMSTMSVGDMTGVVTPFNHPGMIDCYKGLTCSTTSTTPVCCDEQNMAPDAGHTFIDTCVATTGACTGNTYTCGQTADCAMGTICCGTIGTSKTGKPFFKGSNCAATCGSGQTQLCVAVSECKTGTSCTPASISGRDVGLCK